jgi:hypothetical protein
MWRIPELIEEGRRNVAVRRSRVRPVAVIAVLSGSILAATVAAERQSAHDEVEDLASQGWVTATFTADPGVSGQNGISGQSCRDLASVPGVVASGAVSRSVERLVWQLGPTAPVATADTTVIRALVPRPTDSPHIAYLGSALVENGPSTVTVLGTRYRTVALPQSLSAADLGNSIVLAGFALGQTDTCIAVLSPAARLRSLEELTAQLDATAAPVVSSFVIDPPIRHPYVRYLDRPTRFIYVAVGLFLALLYGVSLRSRASEFGAYLTSGTRRPELLVATTSELVLLCSMHFASTAIASVLLARSLDLESALSFTYGATSAAVFLIGGGLASIFATRRNVFELLKDR